MTRYNFVLIILFVAFSVRAEDVKHFTRPLLFAPSDNGIGLTLPQIQWDIDDSGVARLGESIRFDSKKIALRVEQRIRSQVSADYVERPSEESWHAVMSFDWPTEFVGEGKLRIILANGKEFWSLQTSAEQRRPWQRRLSGDSTRFLARHRESQFGFTDLSGRLLRLLKSSQKFRFCIEAKKGKTEQLEICTGLYKSDWKNGQGISPVQEMTATGFVKDQEVGTKGIVSFPDKNVIPIHLQFRNGASFKFTSQPISIQFLDIVWSKDRDAIVLTGQGAKPRGDVKVQKVPANHFWSETGFAEEEIWTLRIPPDAPTVEVPGAWGIPFHYLMKFEDLPNELDRVFMSERVGSGVYTKVTSLPLYSPNQRAIESRERIVFKETETQYDWRFQANKSGETNRSRVDVKTPDGLTWVAHYKLYRGFPFEMSGRLSGVTTGEGTTVALGEFTGSAWTESLAGSRNYYLSHQRWGISGRHLRAFENVAIGDEDKKLYTETVFGLRYNLVPGMWNRDELVGLIAGFNRLEVAGFSPTVLGIGGYWARTMPKVFDDIISVLPFMNYRKYVDMDFTFYPYALDQNYSGSTVSILNFHGKVFWRPRFYGEAGFGYKGYLVRRSSDEAELITGAFYGTAGLGFIF